jgi:hypothetical protein
MNITKSRWSVRNRLPESGQSAGLTPPSPRLEAARVEEIARHAVSQQ